MSRPAPSLHGVLSARVPPLPGYHGRLRLPVRCSRNLRYAARYPLSEQVGTGSPKFLENPHVWLPCSKTPVGTRYPANHDIASRPTHKQDGVSSHEYRLTRLGPFGPSTTLTLAVYASQKQSVPPARRHGRSFLIPRKTRFRLVASSTGRGWFPAGFRCEVSVTYQAPPPRQGLLGAPCLPDRKRAGPSGPE